jgi:hypothetical protein
MNRFFSVCDTSLRHAIFLTYFAGFAIAAHFLLRAPITHVVECRCA